ncbi:MAG TPA: MEDS domain-containing protein [Puia sp.]|nr:MEDS domain-containing protein [Puia sp.]
MKTSGVWHRCDIKTFWSDVVPRDHVVQIYDSDLTLLNTLTAFAADGFDAGDAVIVIATRNHLEILNARLKIRKFNVDSLISDGQYIPLNATDALAKFMVNGWPDEQYFINLITPVFKKVREDGRQIRAFGEMVALLWTRGHSSAALQLEELWNRFAAKESFCLFCAYPKQGFSRDASAAVMHVCSAHSKLIGSDENFPSEIQFKTIS